MSAQRRQNVEIYNQSCGWQSAVGPTSAQRRQNLPTLRPTANVGPTAACYLGSHCTVHPNIVYGLDDLHTTSISSKSASISISISIHDNQHYTLIGSSNISNTYGYLFGDMFCCTEVNFEDSSGNITLFYDAKFYNNDATFSCFSSSLVNREGSLQASYMLVSNNTKVFSSSNGRPSVLVEIPQHEECVVKNNSFQGSFKGVYGLVSFTVMNKSASTSNILSFNSPTERRATLGDMVKDFSQHQGLRGDIYFRQVEFLPVIQYHISSYSGGGHLQTADMVEWITKAHQVVSESKQFNYQGVRIPIPSGLNITTCNWRCYLINYDLSVLCEYLEYGFPLNVDFEHFQPITKVTNHASALRNPEAVDRYFADEVSYKAIVGPLVSSPFKDTHYSPLLTRAKSDGGTRVIVDLSWPLGAGVNQFVPDDLFDFMEFQLKYPTIDHIVQKINEIGSNALLYKVDLERAFHNLRIDPLDYKVLDLMWQNQMFIDISLAFGFKQGAAACQLTTDAVTYFIWTQRHWVANYLDDIIRVSPPPL